MKVEKEKKLKKELNKLNSQNFQLKNIIDNLPGDIYWKNKNGKWAGMNKRCARSLKRMGFINEACEEEVIGMTDYQLFPKNTADGYRENDLNVMEEKIEVTIEEPTKLPTGDEITLLSTKIPLWDKDGHVIGIVGNTIDITDLKNAEVKAKTAEATAAAAVAKAETEEELRKTVMVLVGDIVHDLRTPIATIRTIASLLSTILPILLDVAEEAKELGAKKTNLLSKKKWDGLLDNTIVNSLQSSVIMMDDFINSTLQELSNAQKAEKTELTRSELTKCSSRRILENTLDAYPLNEKIKIHQNISYDFYLMGNSILIMRILFNLIRNSIQQIRLNGKGEITITTENSGDKNLIKIKDTAGGVSPDVASHLFEEYFTTKKHGTGIGLAFCKKMMKTFDGDLTYHTAYGNYIEFILSFPKINDK